MIDLNKLWQLPAGSKRRKLLLTFGALERDIVGVADKNNKYDGKIPRPLYIYRLVEYLLKDPKISDLSKSALNELLVPLKKFCDATSEGSESPDIESVEQRACNSARNALMKILNVTPGEWDLIIAPHNKSDGARAFHSGLFAYIEGLRSPFNLGNIFRTADGLGAEKLFLSPDCVSTSNIRAVRSSMGALDMVPYEVLDIDALHKKMGDTPIFALETGGTPIGEFLFPKRGVVVLGSEELGVNPDTLKKIETWGSKRCRRDLGNCALSFSGERISSGSEISKDVQLFDESDKNSSIVTISMMGHKESLNVGVAFGILLHEWGKSLSDKV